MSTTPPTASKSERTRQRIVDVAIDQFAERGIRATSIASVAKGAGVSPASVFGYFGSKDELFLAAIDSDMERVIGEMSHQFIERHAGVNIHERWVPLWSIFDEVLQSHSLLRRVLLDPDRPVFPRVIDLPFVQAGIADFADEIRSAQFDGVARSDIDPQVASEGLTTLLIGIILTHAQMGIADQPERLQAILAVLGSTLRRCPPVRSTDGAAGLQAAPADATQEPVEESVPAMSAPGDDLAAPGSSTPESDPLTKGARTRERILEVAVQLFAVTGSKGTSVAQIAREVGITPAAVFAHFSSKDELFAAAFDHDVWNMVMSLTAQLEGVPVVERWPGIVDRMWESLDEHPLVQRVVSAKELERSPKLLDSTAMRLGIAGMAERLDQEQRAGIARADVPADQLAEGMVDIANCLLVAQAQQDQNGAPTGWASRLEVLGLALRFEPV